MAQEGFAVCNTQRKHGQAREWRVCVITGRTRVYFDSQERVCCLLVLDSVTYTPQWIRQLKPRDDYSFPVASTSDAARRPGTESWKRLDNLYLIGEEICSATFGEEPESSISFCNT